MSRNTTAFLPVSEILLAAAQEIRDDDFRLAGGRPFYLSAAQRGLQELCYDALWDERSTQVPIPTNLIVELPADCIDLRPGLALFNGDQCDFNNVTTLYIKENLYHKGGQGYVADNHGPTDQLMWGGLWWSQPLSAWYRNRLYFAGSFQGKLYLSSACAAFQNLYIPYHSIGIDDWCEDFRVPMWAREALTDFVIDRAAKRLEQTNANYYRPIIARKQGELSLNNGAGTWSRALVRWKRMDQKQRSDLIMYLSRYGHNPH